MTTDADRLLINIKSNLNLIVDDMSEIIVSKIQGYDDYSEVHKMKLRRIFNQLLDMRDEL